MAIEDDMLRWLHNNGTPEAVELIRYEEDEQYRGCGEGTCGWDEIVVKMYFINDQGKEDYDWYEGEMSDFIKELTDAQ